ncbi:MAG: DUF4118 domain-containing protein [Chitinophagaceae bacterium]|nr:MAG: DUF4118 domain-containing protein [Chitinophagaceae bacterium]
MAGVFVKTVGIRKQYLASVTLVLVVAALCYLLVPGYAYRIVAFILLLSVSMVAVSFSIFPVLLSATLSAFIWDYFFIPPRFRLQVSNAEDAILLLMYFLIAVINAVLTYKIRQVEILVRKKEEKANNFKLYDTILSSLSHELKTPISTIIAATDNLQSTNTSLSGEIKDDLVKEISKAALRLNEQVENLLSMSRLESGSIQRRLTWCDIGDLVYLVINKIEANTSYHTINIQVKTDLPLFRTDKVLLEQIIHNLVNNAIRHTPSGTRINVLASIYGTQLVLIVDDNGSGFPPGEMADVFDKFYRLKSSAPGGTGLGLSIVKGFTEALGGSVTLENNPNGGARFTVTINGELSKLKTNP